MAEYDDFYRRLIDLVALKNVTSRFAMERVKSSTAFPLRLPPERTTKRAPGDQAGASRPLQPRETSAV
jgi:Lrp/AsnC family transcriptional regulator